MVTSTIQEKAYASQVLDPEVHGRLVADIENVARAANIPMHLIWTSSKEYCNASELEYLRHLPTHASNGVFGYVYSGKVEGHPVPLRMMAMAGCCVRNFINAKVMTVQEVLSALKKDAMPSPTVLLIPNFFIGKEQGGSIPAWQVSGLLGLLLNRQSEELQTIVYVESMADMAVQYGDTFKHHFMTNFVRHD